MEEVRIHFYFQYCFKYILIFLIKTTEGNYRKSNSGGMRLNRNDIGQKRNIVTQGIGIKRRWDSAVGVGDQGQNKRPFQQNTSYFPGSAISGSSFQPKQFRPHNFDQSKPGIPLMTKAPLYQQPSYPKFPAYTPMQMPPSLAQYPGIASAVANYTFPPPSTGMK